MKPVIWRRLRQISQIVFLVLFFTLFFASIYNPNLQYTDLFYRMDPLVGIASMIAGRVVIASLLIGAVTLFLTLIFGRVWCGWVCPLGTLLAWFNPKKRKMMPLSESWRKVKYILLLLIFFAALFGNQALLILDPITILNRTFTAAVWPALRSGIMQSEGFLYQYEFLWPVLDWFHQSISYPLFQDIQAVFPYGLLIFTLFVGIVGLNWIAERFWCRYLCPLGGILGIVSRFSLHRREVEDSCSGCGLCSQACPTGTIDPDKAYQSDPSECVVCYDCIVDCHQEGTAFRWRISNWQPAAGQSYDPDRRDVLTGLGAAAAGVALLGVEPVTKREPSHLIRPPGAVRTDFDSLCIRCGECVRVCPTQGLQPILFEAGLQNMMTPTLVPRLGYCRFNCNACTEVCPTGAIPEMTLEEKQFQTIGLARIDPGRCLPWAYATPCIVCEEACPVADKAIKLEEVEIVDTFGEKAILQKPVIEKDLCIGCGICEYQCPMGGEAAIRVYTPSDVGSLPF